MEFTQPLRELSDGSAAIVRGALKAGCTFFAGYPTPPAAPILERMLRELPGVGGVAVRAEDEIASISMCIGAVLGGARAMTATSGPGLSLYSENIGLAIMGEVPLVIVDVQRLGPATGGATTVGQGDVQLARWGTSGGYPLIALAPSTIGECHTLAMRAFALSEEYRCPVLLLTDKELATTLNTVDLSDYVDVAVPPRRAPMTREGGFRPYRYEPAESVPPLTPYGGPDLVRFTGSSHDEYAFASEEPRTVGALNRHLSRKIEAHRERISLVAADLQPGARTLLVSYGVTAGAMREAVRHSRARGRRVSALNLLTLWPVPEVAIAQALRDVEHVVVAELNLGDYRREIERIAGGRCAVVGVNRVDGELISPEQLQDEIL